MRRIDKISKWYDVFAGRVILNLCTIWLAIGLMIIGHDSINWIWWSLTALILLVIREYLK
jgi:hypothetical protein